MFEELDADQSGFMELEEFMELFQMLTAEDAKEGASGSPKEASSAPEPEAAIAAGPSGTALWLEHDKDKSGCMDVEETMALMVTLGFGDGVNLAYTEKLFKTIKKTSGAVDENARTIDYDEFQMLLRFLDVIPGRFA